MPHRIDDAGQRLKRGAAAQAQVFELAFGQGFAEPLELNQQRGELFGVDVRVPLAELAQQPFAAGGAGLADLRVVDRQGAQVAPEDQEGPRAFDAGFGQFFAGQRRLQKDGFEDGVLGFFPDAEHLDEDLGLVGKPAIEGLRGKARAPGDAVGVGGAKAEFDELGRRGLQQERARGRRLVGLLHHVYTFSAASQPSRWANTRWRSGSCSRSWARWS